MALGLVGKKVGMTRIFEENGAAVPVTVVHVDNNRVTQIRTEDNDGYCAVQVTAGAQKASRLNKAEAGSYAKAGVEPGRGFWEFRVAQEQADLLTPGAEVGVSVFEEGQKVDVRAKTKGKGFQGAMKRHGFGGGRATHGNSLSHRALGSTGQNQDPGRVFPGKKMPGQMGATNRTAELLPIVRIDGERSLLLIKGAVPGPKGQMVVVTPSTKKPTDGLYDPAAAKAAAEEAPEVVDGAVEEGAAEVEQTEVPAE